MYTFVLSMDPFLASANAVIITRTSERERPGSQTNDKIMFSYCDNGIEIMLGSLFLLVESVALLISSLLC